MIRSLPRRLTVAVLVPVTAVVLSVALAAPAQANEASVTHRPASTSQARPAVVQNSSPLEAVFGRVFNGQSPRCLDSGIPSDTLLFKCSTSIYQQWEYDLTTEQIKGHDPVGCLDDGAGLNGSLVAMVPCSNSRSQVWSYGVGNNSWQLVNWASGRCLDADLGTINQQGTKVQVWDCNSQASNQKWYFEYIFYTIP